MNTQDNTTQQPERKTTEDLTTNPAARKGQRREQYPGYYACEEFNKQEYDRKVLRFKTKNKPHFDEATNNLHEVLKIFGVEPK